MLSYGPQAKYLLNRVCQAKPCLHRVALPAKAGFSLLETTIAIAIMVSAILGPMGISSQSIRSASLARNTITASNLAQEGLELVKVYRHNNIIAGNSWTNGLQTCSSANGCRIDALDLDVKACSANCDPLKFDDALKLYNYSSGADTIFSRAITISNITNDEIKIRVLVQWSDRFGEQSFNLETSLFNW